MIPLTLAFVLASPDPATKSMSDLAKTVSTLSKRSAIAIFPTYAAVPIPEDAKEVDDIVDPIKKQGYNALISDVAVVYQQGIPQSHWGILRGLVDAPAADKSTFKPVTIPASAVKDNTITFETKDDEIVKIGTLMSLDMPRRIMVSPYFNFNNSNDFPLALSAKDMNGGDFARALAKGLGGKLQIDSKTYTIAFDAASFRTNVSKLITKAIDGVKSGKHPSQGGGEYNGGSYQDYQQYQEASQPAQSNTKEGLTAALNLLGQTINQMSDQLLEQTFAYRGTSTRLNLATFTNLQNPAIQYLRAASSVATNNEAGADVHRGQQPGQNALDLNNVIRRVDPRSPGHLIITTDFRLSLELNMAQNNRRQRGAGQFNGPPQSANEETTVTIQIL